MNAEPVGTYGQLSRPVDPRAGRTRLAWALVLALGPWVLVQVGLHGARVHFAVVELVALWAFLLGGFTVLIPVPLALGALIALSVVSQARVPRRRRWAALGVLVVLCASGFGSYKVRQDFSFKGFVTN